MIFKFHILHISIEMYSKYYTFLNSYLHFKNIKIIEQKKIKFLRIQKNYLIFKSIELMESIIVLRKNELQPDSASLWRSYLIYLYIFTSTKPCCDYVIVVCIHYILWTTEHFYKEFERSPSIILFTKKCIWNKKWKI